MNEKFRVLGLDGKCREFEYSRTAFVFVDCQNDFIDGVLGSEEAKAAMKYVNKVAELPYVYAFATFDTHNNYGCTLECEYLPVEHCVEGSNGWKMPQDLFDELKAHPCFYRIEKSTFGSVSLGEDICGLWDSAKIDCVVFVGFCTDICVVSNILTAKAFTRGSLPMVVIEDACAGVTPEKHASALDVLKSCQVDVAKFDDVFGGE